MTVDITAFRLVNRIGYRASMILSAGLCMVGFSMISLLPHIMPPYAGLCIAVVIYASGGALTDIVVNPLLSALPIVDPKKRSAELSLLHSVFCWSQVVLIIGTTLLVRVLGERLWWIIPLLLAAVPLINFLLFLRVPVPAVTEEEERTTARGLFSNKLFLLMCVGMMCAGAIELIMGQWASTFAENALHLNKTAGDLIGPCMLALTMGIGRTVYGFWGDRMDLIHAMILGGLGSLACYLLVSFSYNPVVDIIGCALVGFCVSFMWPGIMSVCADHIPSGGAAMFALLAVFGDSGGSIGPAIAGAITDACGGDLHKGLLLGILYSVIILVFLFHYKRTYQKKPPEQI